jgi:hypothetical protein
MSQHYGNNGAVVWWLVIERNGWRMCVWVLKIGRLWFHWLRGLYSVIGVNGPITDWEMWSIEQATMGHQWMLCVSVGYSVQ